jgi:hypothetical protein
MRVYELHDYPFYCSARWFPSPEEAKAAFAVLDEAGADGSMDLGCYRFIPSEKPEAGACVVAFVSLAPDGVFRAEKLIGGDPYHLDDGTCRALCLRRARVVKEMLGRSPVSRHERVPHGEGARMHPDGTMTDDPAPEP